VNQLGETWNVFSWVVLVIWFSYMVTELRDCVKFYAMTWSTATVGADEMIGPEGKDGEIQVKGICTELRYILTIFLVIPKLLLNIYVAYIGACFLMFNDMEDDLQGILLSTIEMAFILEMDEIIFEAFSSHQKKVQLGKIEMPIISYRGCLRVFGTYGEFPRLVVIICLASYLATVMHTESAAAKVLTPKQSGVIEGCCNFMQYLKGSGKKTALADGNPCSSFRENYEEPAGLDTTGGVIIPGEATPAPELEDGEVEEVAAFIQRTGMGLAKNIVHHFVNPLVGQ